MKTIYKYKLEERITNLSLPIGSLFLSTHVQNGTISIWFEIDLNAEENEIRVFKLFGTGEILPDENLHYFGTCKISEYTIIHVYEEIKQYEYNHSTEILYKKLLKI